MFDTPDLFYLNVCRTLRGPRVSVDRVKVDLYTFKNIVSKFEVWKGRHFIGRTRAALCLATPAVWDYPG